VYPARTVVLAVCLFSSLAHAGPLVGSLRPLQGLLAQGQLEAGSALEGSPSKAGGAEKGNLGYGLLTTALMGGMLAPAAGFLVWQVFPRTGYLGEFNAIMMGIITGAVVAWILTPIAVGWAMDGAPWMSRAWVGAIAGAATAIAAFFLFAIFAPAAMPVAAVAACLLPGVGATVGIQTAPDEPPLRWAPPGGSVALRF
jgi:hypothetical protein